MSRATMTASKADAHLQRYLDMGPGRSIRGLALESQRTDSAGWSPPQERTLFRWSAQYGWDRRAKQFDREVAERARRQLLQRRADMAQARMDIALDTSMELHRMVRSAITIEDEASAGNPDGPVLRARSFAEMTEGDIYAMLALLGMARSIDDDILGDAPYAYEEYQEQQGQGGPAINVLGPEAVMEMGIKVRALVKKLSEGMEARKAAKQDAIEHNPDEDEPDDDDDDDIEWEEVRDDE
jgi:hypothetical protein